MTDISSTSTKEDISPILNKKMVLIKTASMATSDTIDVAAAALGNFASIDFVIGLADDGTAGDMVFTWSGTVITAGTLTTGIHHLIVVGNSA